MLNCFRVKLGNDLGSREYTLTTRPMTEPDRAGYFMLPYYGAAENVECPSVPGDIMKGSDFSTPLINTIKTKIRFCYLFISRFQKLTSTHLFNSSF